ncbi:MAG: hypothetical protein ACLPZR_05395 [Solirubrobacteraceae bacterium]
MGYPSRLAEPEWADVLTAEKPPRPDPSVWARVLAYGEVKLNLTGSIGLRAGRVPDPDPENQ